MQKNDFYNKTDIGFNPRFYHTLTVWPWTSYLYSMILSFLTCKLDWQKYLFYSIVLRFEWDGKFLIYKPSIIINYYRIFSYDFKIIYKIMFIFTLIFQGSCSLSNQGNGSAIYWGEKDWDESMFWDK